MDVSIIIVNYNTKDLTLNCIRSIKEKTSGIDYEIIVSDNGSVDSSIEAIRKQFPDVILVENNANLGFGAANNRGLKIAKGKYIFYLNSDTLLLNNAIKIFFDYFEKNGQTEKLGALGCNLLNSEKNVIHSYGCFENPANVNEKVHMIYKDMIHVYSLGLKKLLFKQPFPTLPAPKPSAKKTGSVDYITGADLFLLNNENAYFDEKYFMYVEELDLEYRLSLKYLNRILIEGPEIIHLEGASAKKENDYVNREKQFSRINWRLSSIIFYKKFGAPLFKIFIWKCIVFLMWLNPFLFGTNRKYIKKLVKI